MMHDSIWLEYKLRCGHMITKSLRLAVTVTYNRVCGGIVVDPAAFTVGDMRPTDSARSHDGGTGGTFSADLSGR